MQGSGHHRPLIDTTPGADEATPKAQTAKGRSVAWGDGGSANSAHGVEVIESGFRAMLKGFKIMGRGVKDGMTTAASFSRKSVENIASEAKKGLDSVASEAKTLASEARKRNVKLMK